MNQPIQLAGRRRAGVLAAMNQGLAQPAVPRISIKAQRFTLIDSAGVQIPVNMFDGVGDPQRGLPPFGLYLDAVIIGANPNKSKIYYENEYDPTKDEPPTCFSDNGVAPSAQATVPQSPTCAVCPNGVWGSDTSKMTGKPTKLCNDRKKLAVIVVNDPSQLIYQLQIPPTSLKNLSVLANSLKTHQVTDAEGQRPADPADVVTRVYFNPQKQGELLFQPMGFHQQMAPYVNALIEKADASGVIDVTTGANDIPYQGAIALPNPQVMAALPPPAMQTQAPPPAPSMQPISQAFQQPPRPDPFQGGTNVSFTAAAQPPQAQVNGGFPTAPPVPFPQPMPPQAEAPVPRTRRGGARAGAGRPPQNSIPVPQPLPAAAPFQQQAPQQTVQQFAPPQAPQPVPFGSGAVPSAGPTGPGGNTAPAAGMTSHSSGPVPFQPQAAQPFTGQAPHAQPVPTQGVQEGIPPFLQRVPTQQGPGSVPAFGMQNGAQPDSGLQAALQNAFGAPTQPRQR